MPRLRRQDGPGRRAHLDELRPCVLGWLSLVAAGDLGDVLSLPPGTHDLTIEAQDVTIDVGQY